MKTPGSAHHAGTERSLNGKWRFRTDPHDLGERFAEELHYTHAPDARWMGSGYDDATWDTISVPAHWQTEGHAYDGTAWYRTTFRSSDPEVRTRLTFQGVDYCADVWLNDRYLGSHEGYFAEFGFEITHLLDPRDNVLAVRVSSPIDVLGMEHEQGQLKSLVKGSPARWDMNNPEIRPAGLWNDVILEQTGVARIESVTVDAYPVQKTGRFSPDESVDGLVDIGFHITSHRPSGVTTVSFEIARQDGTVVATHTEPGLPVGRAGAHHTIRLPVRSADLWWIWELGDQPLYTATITAHSDGVPSHTVARRFGFRTLSRGEGTSLYLNGHRIFQRGANYLSDQFLSLSSTERYEKDLHLVKEANLNTIHPFCVVERHEFYDICDEIGLLVYQDFPLWMMASNESDLVRRALPQGRALIEQWGHHPSIAIWNLGSQPSQANFTKLSSALTEQAQRLDPTRVINQANAAFAYDDEDTHPTRSFFWHQGTGAEMAEKHDWRFDTHIYAGWYFWEASEVGRAPSAHLEMVTEFGAQSLPRRETLESIIPPDDLFPPRWSSYAARCCQVDHLLARVPMGDSLDEFIADSQDYQALVLREHIEFYRRHKFKPCNGAHLFAFGDCWPAITWSIVEYDRTPKAAYATVRRAMAPLQIFLTPTGPLVPTDTWRLEVTVVNDLLSPVAGAVAVDADYFDADGKCGSATTTCPCQVDGSSSRAFDVDLVAPPERTERAKIRLSVFDPDERCSNSYLIETQFEDT